MQLYLCHTSLPWTTSGVMFSALVSSPKRMWLWTVMPRKAIAARAVATTAKIRDCRLFMACSSDPDRWPVVDRRVGRIDGCHRHQHQDDPANPGEDGHQACRVHSTAPRMRTGPTVAPLWTACNARAFLHKPCTASSTGRMVAHETREGIVQLRHGESLCAAERAVAGASRGPPQPRGTAGPQCAGIDGARVGGAQCELGPGHRFAVGEVPDAGLAIHQQVEARMHQVRHVGG